MAVIKANEFSFELGWKTLKDLLAYEGIAAPLPDGQVWIDMLEQRAQRALALIRGTFAPALRTLERITAVLRRFPSIRWAKLYGSRALGRQRPGSDIDLAFSSPVAAAPPWPAPSTTCRSPTWWT